MNINSIIKNKYNILVYALLCSNAIITRYNVANAVNIVNIICLIISSGCYRHKTERNSNIPQRSLYSINNDDNEIYFSTIFLLLW